MRIALISSGIIRHSLALTEPCTNNEVEYEALIAGLELSLELVPRASGPVFMFCAPRLVFSGTEGVGSRFYVLCTRTRFRRYRGHRVPFSCFLHPDSFSAVPRASGPVFMFCMSGLVFGGTKGVWYRFHVLHAWTCF
jgi:hypothetical protein